jgi:hypothetical protein
MLDVQLHTTPEHKDELKKYGMEPLQFDGMGEMYIKSLEDWVKFQGSPAFVEKLASKSHWKPCTLPLALVLT